MPEEELEDIELIGLIEGTVDDLKDYVRNEDLEKSQLETILRSEKEAKDRKTAKRFLKGTIEEKDSSSESESSEAEDDEGDGEKAEKRGGETEAETDDEDIEIEEEGIDREQLLKILGGTVEEMKEYVREKDPSDSQLQEILHAEKVVNDRKTAVRFLNSYSKKEELKQDIRHAEHDFQELRDDLDRIEKDVLDEDIDLDGIEPEDLEAEGEEAEPEQPERDEESHEGEDSEGDEESSEDKDEENESDEQGGEESGEEKDEEELMKEKKEVAEDLDTDLSEEDLEDIPLEELKAIRDDKMERQELIEDLSGEFDREELKNASTSDLRKLKEDLDGEDEDEEEDDEEEVEKEDDEIKEEAQEDLEMLMGAVKDKGGDGESKDRLAGIKDLRNTISEKLSFRSKDEDDEKEEAMPKDEVIGLLEDYQELEKYEASIKIAHIMKGYLEFSEGIDRELTYRELSEELDADSEEMETLIGFFGDMQKDQYTGDITTDTDEVVDAAKKVVEKRS